jgi:hypothetical protein
MYDGEGALSDDVEQLVAGLAAGGGRKAALHYEHTLQTHSKAFVHSQKEDVPGTLFSPQVYADHQLLISVVRRTLQIQLS